MRAFSVIDDEGGRLTPSWRKSTRSAHNGNCVEVAQFPAQQVAVRDSKNPAGAPVVMTAQDWARFVAHVKNS